MKVWSESWGDLKPSNVFLTEDWLLRAASHKHNEKTIAHMFAFSCLLSSTRVDNWGGIPQIVRIVPHYLSLRPLLKGFAIRATGWFWHLQESKIHCQLVPNSRRYAGRPGSFALGLSIVNSELLSSEGKTEQKWMETVNSRTFASRPWDWSDSLCALIFDLLAINFDAWVPFVCCTLFELLGHAWLVFRHTWVQNWPACRSTVPKPKYGALEQLCTRCAWAQKQSFVFF